MKRYIVDGNVTDTRHVVGFASERLFVDYTDHAALLCAVAEEARKLRHAEGCHSFVYPNTNATTPHAPRFVVGRLDESKCNCPRGKVLAMLEVEK